MAKKKITKDDAIEQLWRMGELKWKLNPVQKELDQIVENDTTKISVVVVSRRTGKTTWLLIRAFEQCLKHPNSIVKFIFPKQKDAKTNIMPLFRMITEDCPNDIRPKYNTQDKIFNFHHNGSQIQLAGSDLGGVDSIRGGSAHLCIVDESGFCEDLKYAIRSVLAPTIRTTNGRIIMASTPPISPDHEFATEFMIPYMASNRLKIFTIYDNPNFNEKIIKEILEDYPLGDKDPDFRREYLCELSIDAEKSICPEFSQNKQTVVIKDDDLTIPIFKDFYVSFDVGFKDLTAGLFGYYDFKNACLVILDEFVANGPDLTTEKLAQEIKHKETLRFYNKETNELQTPYLRVMDNNLAIINDLHRLHELYFIPTKKDNKDAQVNNMRIWVSQNRIKIHERCKHLIYHLEYGQWNNNRDKFKHLADSPDKSLKGGHVDTVDALIYMVRNINEFRNPYPVDFGQLKGHNVWKSKNSPLDGLTDAMQQIFNIKKKR